MISTRVQRTPFQNFRIKFLKYFEIAKISYSDAVAYVSEPMGFAFLMLVRIWVFFELYSTVYRSRGTATINGFSLATTIWLLSIVQVFQTSARIKKQVKNLGDNILNGNIIYSINRPYDYMIFYIGENLGDMIANVAIAIVLVCITAFILVGPIDFHVKSILLGSLLMCLGILMNLVTTFILGVTAFWSESTHAARWIYDKMVWVFGGSVVPITFFPDKLRSIVEFFPFTNLYYGPARIMVAFDQHLFFKFLAVQIFWIIALVIIGRKLFRRGVKQLSINGG